MTSEVDHPAHYGGADDPYEAIRVIEAWGVGFHLGNALKYIARADKKGDEGENIDKAIWYLRRYRENLDGLHSNSLGLKEPYEPFPGEVHTLLRVYKMGAAYCAKTDKAQEIRLPLHHSQSPPRAGDRVTLGSEGFTYIERKDGVVVEGEKRG